MPVDDLMLGEFDPRHSADGESHIEAAMRDDLRKVLSTRRPNVQLTADLLPVGCAVKVAGEWYEFRGLDARGRLILGDSGSASGPWLYGPTDGETFAYSTPFPC